MLFEKYRQLTAFWYVHPRTKEPKLNAKRKQMIMEAKPSMGYIELTDEEISVFKKKAQPLREKYLEMGGEGAREVLDAVLNDIQWAKKN